MTTVQVHLAYTPRGVGLTCALMYLKQDPDVFGWWIGRQGAEYHTAYFRLAGFYSTGTVLYTSDGSDLYGGFKYRFAIGKTKPLDPPQPAPPDATHVLAQAQDAFCGEWLIFPGDKDWQQQHQAYTQAELAWSEVNFKIARLNKFDKHEVVWVYYSNDFEAAIGKYLMQRWPLDYCG